MAYSLHQTVWIPLQDGKRLAATIWMPDGDGPFPAVLEYLPYRRGDGTAPRDDSTYPHFAENRIVGVRVDSRGQGDSDGLFDDEYSPTELSDACEVIAWIAAQEWSNGGVGMMGISWGGFNGLQVAALRPPALKAVVSIAATVDRFADDIHFKGGAMLSANVYWAGTMLSYNSRPPDPDVVGDRWEEIWKERLAAQPMLLETWLRHQRRDVYWQHGSVCEDWNAIGCPVWVIAGWADGYRNCPATLAEHLSAPVKAMTGPWIHKYPHFAWPKPRADFLGMAVDWWHHWLSGQDRGVTEWPDYSAYMAEAIRPRPWREADSGRWIGTDWPGNGASLTLTMGGDGRLGSEAPGETVIASPQHCGVAAGEYFTLTPGADLAADQRADDALSACWDGPPLTMPMEILGRPLAKFRVRIDAPHGNLIARLVDVHPDGTAALIARGVLNLCHRNGSADPQPMTVGVAEEVELPLDQTAYRLPAGHRLRLAISTAYFPMVLPSPVAVTAEIAADGKLALPLPGEIEEIVVAEPPIDTFPVYPRLAEGHAHRSVAIDLGTGRVAYTIDEDSGLTEVPRNGMQTRESRHEVWEIASDDPLSVNGTLAFETLRQRGAWIARTLANVRFSATATTWEVEADLTAWNGEREIIRRDWRFSVPRDLM